MIRDTMVRGRRNPFHYGLPSRLKKTRQRTGLNRTALAKAASVADSTIRHIETNERLPTVATLASLSAALTVSAAWLSYGLGDQHTDGPPATCAEMGARLTLVRVERGLTKAALARLVRLTPSTVADIEKGAQTGIDVLEALAKALNVSPAWLAFNQGPRELPKRRRAAKPTAPAPP